VARLAACNGFVCPDLPHTVIELPFVRVRMAAHAIQVSPVIDSSRVDIDRDLCGLLVTVTARNGNVASGENEARFPVAQKRERRRFVAFKIVATVTSIEVRRIGELPGVTIAMTVRAPFKFNLEKRSLAPRDVALSAFQPGVPAL
jgi:hypothetical protein